MATVYRREPSRSGSGFVVNYTATTAKQSWVSAQKSKEIQAVYQRGHYVTGAGLRNDMLLGLGGLAVMFLSAAAGGVTLYFGGPGKAAVIYLATCVLGFTGVVVNCERE